MRKRTGVSFLSILCVVLLFSLWLAAQAPAQSGGILFVNANIIDGVSPEPIRGGSVLVRDGKIAKVAPGKVEAPAGVQVIDLKGKWLLSGFIDAHTHIGDMNAARRALQSGSTTVRILGVGHFADVGIRDLHRAGVLDLPDALASGYHMRPQLAPDFFLDFPQLHELMDGIRGPEAARRAVRALASRKLDWIKINTTERAGLPDDDPMKQLWSDEEIAAIVDEARKNNLPVAAHAHGDEGAAAAVRAGVRSIEHGTYMSEATLRLMRERGTCFVPTVATIVDMSDPQGEDSNAALAIRGRAMVPRLRDTVAMARKLGVKIVAATDTGYSGESILRLPVEITELVASGLTPMEAIQSATSVAADCLGIEKRTGSIRAGLEADLVVMERNPLEDIRAVQEILVVVNDGKVVRNRIAN